MVAPRPVIDQLLATFAQATEANLRTPCRRGNVIEITPEIADDVMITADLHGQRLNYNKLLEIADLDNHPRRHLVMQEVCHGGPMYPSGAGDMSHLMLEDMAALKVRYPDRFHFIASNHELAEATDFPILKAGKMLNLLFRCGLMEMYGDAVDEVREAYRPFLRSCPIAVRLASGAFICHSAPERSDTQPYDATVFDRPITDDDVSEGGPVFQLVWGRDFRPANGEAFARLVGAEFLIHGHEPCQEGFHAPNHRQLIIDCANPRATYLILPVAGKISHADAVKQVKRVW